MLSDLKRRELYTALSGAIGPSAAESLMEALPPFGWSELAQRSDLALLRGDLTTEMSGLRSEMADVRTEIAGVRTGMADVRTGMAALRTELKTDMADLRTEVRTDMADLRTEVRTDMADLRTESADLRGELSLKIDGQLPRFLLGNIPIIMSAAGLVLAAAKLA